MKKTRNLILASSSPRRKRLLKKLGLSFRVMPSNLDESMAHDLPPEKLAKKLAYEKARLVAAHCKDGLIIGADTIVVVKGKVIGKPTSYRDAKRILKLLSNTTHRVITALAVIDAKTNKKIVQHENTVVKLREIKKEEIEKFARLHYDKAGSYAAQENNDALIERVEGDFFNVVGLPLKRLKRMLKRFGVMVKKDV
ncbi:MAG: Maf family protein [Candidatus Omnitrophota bacterium]